MLQTRVVCSALGPKGVSRLLQSALPPSAALNRCSVAASSESALARLRHAATERSSVPLDAAVAQLIASHTFSPYALLATANHRSLPQQWLRSSRYAHIPMLTQRISHRSYCQKTTPQTPSQGLSKDPLHPDSKEKVSETGSSTNPSPQLVENYGRLLWKRLKMFPTAFRRFLGFHGPFTLDKTLPFVNLMFVGIGLGILVGTTSVISAAIWVVNRNDRWKEMTAHRVSEYLSYQMGMRIEYESMSASWKDRRITLQNVKLERDPFIHPEGSAGHNVTAIKLDVQRLTVSVSLLWLLQGNGLLKTVLADGVTGFFDQRHLNWTGWTPPKRVWQRGDFFLDSFKLSNCNLSLYLPAPDRELKIQIHSIDCEKFRKQWLLRDLLCAKSAYGIFDGSLFSLTRVSTPSASQLHHQHQVAAINAAANGVIDGLTRNTWPASPSMPFLDPDDEDADFLAPNIRSSLKIDGVKSDLLSTSSSGPISWITEGTIDIDIDLDFRSEYFEEGWHYHMNTETHDGFYSQNEVYEEEPLIMDIKLKLNNLRADIPITTDQLTLINRALVIPVIAYMNTNYTCIPLAFPVHVPREQFNGAWSPWDASLFDAISTGVAQQFLTLVKEQQTSTNLQKHILFVIKSLHRGLYFLRQQVQGYYSLWYFNNDEHPEDLYAL